MPTLDNYRIIRLASGCSRGEDGPGADLAVMLVESEVERPLVPTVVAFRCPCGCNKVTRLNVDPDFKGSDVPYCWTFSVNSEGRPTLHPSVKNEGGCGSHYFIKEGKVEWCDGGPPNATG